MGSGLSESYNAAYGTPNLYGHRRWLYRPMIKAAVARARLAPGSTVLDAGCGQGQFSHLLGDLGLTVLGLDLSEVGVMEARRRAGPRERFEVADLVAYRGEFDGVFCRSFSPYNTDSFAVSREWTERLLALVRPGGALIWCYNSRLDPLATPGWRQHTVEEACQHFGVFDADVFYTLRVECRLGAWTLNRAMTRCARLIARVTGRGGELIAIVRRR